MCQNGKGLLLGEEENVEFSAHCIFGRKLEDTWICAGSSSWASRTNYLDVAS